MRAGRGFPNASHNIHEQADLTDPVKALLVAPKTREADLPTADRHAADVEMARVLETAPLHMALDPSGAGIAHWKHDLCTMSSNP